jgi:hypothetical protein
MVILSAQNRQIFLRKKRFRRRNAARFLELIVATVSCSFRLLLFSIPDVSEWDVVIFRYGEIHLSATTKPFRTRSACPFVPRPWHKLDGVGYDLMLATSLALLALPAPPLQTTLH